MKKLNIKTVVFAGVLIAMNLVLERVLSIQIGNILRISLAKTPLYLASLWLGPMVGGICGGVSDLLGCLIAGYAPNPFITCSAILSGILPGLMKKYVFQNKLSWVKICIMIVLDSLIGSMGLTTLGLHIYYGTPWSVLYASRTIQTIALVVANTLTVAVLYQSVLTSYIQQNVYGYGRRAF